MLSDPDAELIANDRARPGWKRRAVGMTRDEALAHIPRHGQFQTSVTIGAHRAVIAHIARLGTTRAQWFREAVAAHYLAQGGDQAVAHQLTQARKHRD